MSRRATPDSPPRRARRAPLSATAPCLILALAAGLGGCLEELPAPHFIDDLRVLAIRADPPEVGPGASVTLEALVVDPEDRPITLTWSYCVAPDITRGFFGGGSETSSSGGRGFGRDAAPACAGAVAAGDPFSGELGGGDTVTFEIPADIFDSDAVLKLAYGLPAELEIPPAVVATFLGVAGVNLTVALTAETGERRVETFKRVKVRLPGLLGEPPNVNPAPLAVHLAARAAGLTPPETAAPPPGGGCFVEGGDGPLTPGAVHELWPLNIPAAPPRYTVLLPGTTGEEPFDLQTVEETLFYSFYTTVGSFQKDKSKSSNAPDNTWRIPSDAQGDARVWVVVRDGRGGTRWCASTLPIGAPGR